MIVYVGGSFTVRRQATVTSQIPCQKCGTLYGYNVTRWATGTGRSPYYTDNEGARRRAYQSAEANLQSAIANTVDVVPCPSCGSFQANMVQVLWSRKHSWMLPAGTAATIIGAFLLFVSLIGRNPNPTLIAILAVVLLGGVALLIVKPMLRSKFDPNVDCAARAGRPAPGVFVIPTAQAAAVALPAARGEAAVWYQVKDGQQLGPLTESAMRERAVRGELQPADLVWKQGQADWAAASGVKEFFVGGKPARSAVPPPLPARRPMPPALPIAAAGALPVAPAARGMPVWGWALISIGALLLVSLVFVFVRQAREAAYRVRCTNNMRQIGAAMSSYAMTHGGRYPASAQDLFVNSTLDPIVLVCPSGDETPAPGSTRQQQAANLNGSHLSYTYLANGQSVRASRNMVLMYEKPDAHRGTGINLLFADGHAEFVLAPRARQLIQSTEAALASAALARRNAPHAGSTVFPGNISSAPPAHPAPLVRARRTAVVGGVGGSPWSDASPSGENVIGFRYEMGSWAGQSIVHTLEPLYASTINNPDPHNPPLPTVRARNGYIVGGMIVDGKNYAAAIRILFVRWDGLKAHADDNYLSPWLGTPIDDVQPTQLAGHGERVTGIFGRKGLNVDALGLVVVR